MTQLSCAQLFIPGDLFTMFQASGPLTAAGVEAVKAPVLTIIICSRQYFDTVGVHVDLEASRAITPEPLTLEAWARKKGFADMPDIATPAASCSVA
jgi:hypothetical protein